MNRRSPPPFFRSLRPLLWSLLWLLAACQAHSGMPPPAEYAPGRVLLGVTEPLAPEAVAERLAPLGMEVLRPLMGGRVFVVGLPEGMTVPEALRRLQRLEWVRYAEPDYVRRPHGQAP